MASAICEEDIFSAPSRSATVRAVFRIRLYARILSCMDSTAAFSSFTVQTAEFAEGAVCQLGIAVKFFFDISVLLQRPGCSNAGCNLGRRLCRNRIIDFLYRYSVDFNLNVDPVEKGA